MIFHILILVVALLAIRYLISRKRLKNSIAFFHLHCSSGGGGERVLWHTAQALLNNFPQHTIYIYSHNGIKKEDKSKILIKVRDLFKIDLIHDHLNDRIEFIPLTLSPLIEAKRYPYLTLLLQSLASVLLGIEACIRLIPDLYIESIGFAFTLPIFKLLSCKVITYVHYPTISSDMIENVRIGTHSSFNNRELFVRYEFFRKLKLIYYKLLVTVYRFAGRRADLVLVNSSWTKKHIDSLWNIEAHVVYPPCDIDNFNIVNTTRHLHQQEQDQSSNGLSIISIAQFRPEKNHQLQVEAFDLFLETSACDSKLVLYGGCRDDGDKKRVSCLKDFVHRLGLSSNVEIYVGASFERLIDGMRQADVAIHTMENEHFGIVLVECMAAGLICVAHNSGGPKTDIIDDGKNGFLANNIHDFSEKLVLISRMTENEREKMRQAAVEKSRLFSARVFEDSFLSLMKEKINM